MKDQKGFSLISVMIAVALLGIIAASFLGALGTASRVLFTVDERETAKNLAESQMECVKEQAYALTYSPAAIPDEYAGYSVEVSADEDEVKVGLQVITVKIYHHDDAHANPPVLTLEDYKVDR